MTTSIVPPSIPAAIGGSSDRLVPLIQVALTIGVSRSKFYELLETADFPRPVKIGRRTHFSEREVQAWISARLAERTAGVAHYGGN